MQTSLESSPDALRSQNNVVEATSSKENPPALFSSETDIRELQHLSTAMNNVTVASVITDQSMSSVARNASVMVSGG